MTDLGTITAIKADAAEPDLRTVWVGRKCIAHVRRHVIDDLSLKVGAAVDDATHFTLAEAHRRTTLRIKAIRSLSRATASSGRLTSRLLKSGGEMNDIEQVLAELTQEGLLDDHDTARRIAVDTLRKTPVGRERLRVLLLNRQFADEVIERVVDEVLATHNERQDVLQAAKQCMGTLQSLPRETAARRLASRLSRRGFSEESVTDAITTCLGDEDTSLS
ncbi:MAG: hypothetical protein GY894_01850 [Planctomycetes bacterium]|nr:hypothetical protein [Planctomycetota bacterium]MCP4838093.1 hypothetical protein [Planctomycetota bacterium]